MQDAGQQFTARDHFHAATRQMSEKNPRQAFAICVVGLENFPDDSGLLCLAAQSCIAQGFLKEARLYIDKAIASHVGMALVHEINGDVCLLEGKPGEAVKAYRQAGRLNPAREGLQARIDRARELMNSNRPVAGKRRQELGFPEEMARAGQLERDGEPARAEKIYRDILRKDPEHVEAIRLLAAVATRHRRHRDAEVFLKQAVSIAPDYARLWLDLTAAQLEQEKLDDAIASAQRLVELTPEVAESHIALGNALARADQAHEAMESYRSAQEISVAHKGAMAGLAQQLKTLGRQDEAIAVHRENILRNPTNAEPYWSLANMKTFSFTDGDFQTMEELLKNGDLDELGRVQLCNALGFAYESRCDYDRAFEYFQLGNDRRRGQESYDPVQTEESTGRHIEVFTPAFIEKNEGQGDPDPAPLFIVGLPRSGSTLIEQILASHSQVEGTHELNDLPMAVHLLPRNRQDKERFPLNLPGLKPHWWAKLGADYLERTSKYRGKAQRFIDKNPNNFVYCGLLHLILPNAKIINARRHPMDSCFGSYKQLFASGQPFTYDLTEIGEYYLQYQKLMDHWHEVMPGKVLDVQYEEVVADLETQVRRILDYCGLPFEQACLDFHQTDRAVKTASSEQVRQPIYTSSVNLWKNYETHLDELLEVLEPLLKN